MRRSGFIDCFSGDPLQGRDATRLPVFPNRWFQSERLEDEITGEVHQLDEFEYDPHKDVVVISKTPGRRSTPRGAATPTWCSFMPNRRRKKFWKRAGIDIGASKGAWYREIGQGMGAALTRRTR